LNLFLSHEILNHLIGVFDKTEILKPITPFKDIETLFQTSLSESYDMGLIDASHLKKMELEDIRELFHDIPLVLCCRDLVGFRLAREQSIRAVDEIIYISSIEAVHLEQILTLIHSKFKMKLHESDLKLKISRQELTQREHHSNVTHQQLALLELAQLKFKQETLEHTFENIGLIILDTLGIERFSVWLMDSHLEKLKCQCLVTSEGYQTGDEEPIIERHTFPDYFDHLEKGHSLTVEDIKNSNAEERVYQNFSANCLSILETPLFEDGVIYGTIRFEEWSENRTWSIEEKFFADAVSDMVTMAIDQWNLHKVEEDHKRKEDKLIKKLERSNRELKDFTSIVSHDLQEPLYKINAFGELLEEICPQLNNEDALFFVQRIRNSTSRMQNLIKDLLSFSRVQSLDKKFEEIDLNQVFEICLNDLEIRIKEKNAVIESDLLPKVSADATQMQQLFQNILSNAFKFTKPNENPKIYISSKFNKKNGITSLMFKDNGIGINPEFASKIFGVFQRLSSQDEFEGTGIGLAIVKKIVDQHGWNVYATGETNEGMSIHIDIPNKRLH